MKVLVTGATGFVGSCLTRRMVEEGHDVHILLRRDSSLWRIADLAGRYLAHEADLRDAPVLASVIDGIAPEVIFHLATYGGFAFQKEREEVFAANLTGTINLVNACARTGFSCFVNTGSSSEYGAKSGPMAEADLLEPLGDYGISKAAATLYCRSLAIERNLPVTTIRLFSPYGPWDDPRRLIPYVTSSLLRGVSPSLTSPDSVRDFIFIEDILDLYLKLMSRPHCGAIINAGSGRQHGLGEVVGIIEELVESGPKPEWGARDRVRPEPEVWVADIGKAGDLLQWFPQTALRQGLAKTVDWFRTHLHYYGG